MASAEPPLPPPASGPITITTGGTYRGNWVSTSSAPAVTIATSEPVRIVDSTVTNLADGVLILSHYGSQGSVTIDRVTAYGGNGRFVEAEKFKSVTIRNCTIERTSGIKLASPVAGASVLITRNKHRNIQKGSANYGNFVQLAEVQTASVEISWNEIVNDFDRSDPEDLVSIFKSAHARVHDNYFHGQYPPGNSSQSSQNGITIENGNGVGPSADDNEIWNNQVVDSVGGIGVVAGNRNRIHDNRVVQDGYLANGVKLRTGTRGLSIHSGSGNRAFRNVVGFVNAYGKRSDMWFPVTPRDYGRNTSLRGKVRRATEMAERRAWLDKVAANRVRIGA